ncbi:hypothetical protein Tco_0715785 [Tanacetum coccineum]
MQNTMVEQNVPAQAPTRPDEQILPRPAWLKIGKSNLLFDAKKIQKNPIFHISVDILHNTNFFRAFSASASVLAIYIQQFWNTMKYDEKTGVYYCQVDEQWVNLSADLLRKALDITPVNPAHLFELPLTGDTVIDFVNQLGYPELVEFVSNIRVNYVYQPWRAILSLINQCLTGKTSGKFTQGIQTFFSHKASHKASLRDPKKKAVPFLIPYGRFTKMIIYYLGSPSNVHRRPESPRHLPGDDFLLGNLKFIRKGKTDEVFRMAIPKPLITEAIQQSSYYLKYLEMVAKNTKKTPQDSASKQSVHGTKHAPSKKHLPSKQNHLHPNYLSLLKRNHPRSLPQEKFARESLRLLMKKMKLNKNRNLKEKLSLDPSFLPQRQAPVRGVAIRERVAEEIQRLPYVEGKGKAIVTEEQAAHSLIDLSKKKKATAPKVDKEQCEVASTTVTSGVGISIRTENQAGSDPGQGHEALVGSNLEPMQEDSGPGKEHVALTGPNPEHMDEDFYATAYPKVHENLKLRNDEHVILENPKSSFVTLSSMKNLDETDNFGDQFLNDKPTEDDQEKTNVVDETDSIIPDLSHQTNTPAPLVTTPVINISSPKPSLQVNAPPINTEATAIITTIPEITPFIALQVRVMKLEQDMSEVKKTDHSTAVLASIQSQVPTVVDKYLGTKVDDALLKALEKHTVDLIQKYPGLPAPESSKNQESEKSPEEILIIKREQEEHKHVPTYTIKSTNTTTLKEFDLKAALFKTIHENKSANRNPANNRLYHALMEALIEDENAMEKEVADKVKDHKRKHDSDDDEDDDDEGPPARSNQGKSTKRRRYDSGASGSAQPPSKDSEQSTKNKLDSDASAAQQPPAHTSSAWKITDTRDAPSGSLMPRSEPQSEQSSNDIQIQNEEQDSDSDDNDNAHVPKVQSTTSWFRPIPEEDRPATPEPEWTIPLNDYPEPENNWANVYATTYQDPEENKLQRKTGDIGSFIKWFCKRIGKKKLCKADLEGPTFNLVKSFHKNSVSL